MSAHRCLSASRRRREQIARKLILCTVLTTGTVHVSFAGLQNTADGPFETLDHIIESGNIGSEIK